MTKTNIHMHIKEIILNCLMISSLTNYTSNKMSVFTTYITTEVYR